MGKIAVKVRLQNWSDLALLAAGASKARPRAVEAEALVDSGATKLYLQRCVIQQLGLRKVGEAHSQTMSNRREKRDIYSPVELEIQGRNGRFDVVELPDELPNIIGQIPLEDMDWVVDLKNRKLIPNPDHKGGVRFDDF